MIIHNIKRIPEFILEFDRLEMAYAVHIDRNNATKIGGGRMSFRIGVCPQEYTPIHRYSLLEHSCILVNRLVFDGYAPYGPGLESKNYT